MYDYDLFAVINHEGQMDNGHYYNYARSQDEVRLHLRNLMLSLLIDGVMLDQWNRFDDDK